MNDRDFETLINAIAALFVLIIVLCPVIALWIYIILQNGKRKRIRARIVASRPDLVGNKRWFPVRYASQPRFDSFAKILPWEAAGILLTASGSLLFLGETFAGTSITLQFAPGNARVNWLGRCPWPNGAVSWLSFDTADQRHYFSSETGIMIFGSHRSTRAIYDEVSRNFGRALESPKDPLA
jgi:hypothetical protein